MKKRPIIKLILSIICLVLTLVFVAGTIVGGIYETVINVALDTQTYKVISGNDSSEDTDYYSSAFESQDALHAYELALCQQLEEEGAVLLMNKDNTLPLDTGSKISLFSQSAARLVYGGTGSGYVNVGEAPNFRDALLESGFLTNDTLWRFYISGPGSDYIRGVPATTAGDSSDYLINEVPWSEYTSGVKDSFSSYGDAAIIVLARSGGEGVDLAIDSGKDSTNGDYLMLNQDEIDLLANVKAYKDQGVFDKIIIILNTANALNLDFLQGDTYGVDAVLWIGHPGFSGIQGVANIIAGDVNPSGKMVATYAYDSHSAPAMENFGAYHFTNLSEWDQIDESAFDNNGIYVVYQEGIYVGYRYYETRYEDFVMGTGNAGTYDYSSTVAFPFGSGLSYTDFSYSDYSGKVVSGGFELTVTVTNEGSVAGKNTVLAFFQSPYTQYDKDNGIEKAAVELCGFEKTDLLQPGESQDITIFIDKEELRSYDAYNAETYILDEGDYLFTIADDAHAATNNFLASKGYTPATTSNRMTETGDASKVFVWNNPSLDTEIFSTSSITGNEITNQFDNADVNLYEGTQNQTINYLSRSDWDGTLPTTNVSLEMTQIMREDGLVISDNLVQNYIARYLEDNGYDSDFVMPVLNADNGMTLIMYLNVAGDAEIWNQLIDQASFSDMQNLISQGFHKTQAVESLGLPGTKNENGPQGLTASLVGGFSSMAFTSEDVRAAAFNRELSYQVGEAIGEDCLYAGYSGLYGPGANIHRTPYSGRNFEYYSEDPYVSGQIGTQEVSGINSKGVWVEMKHFLLNDQETGRFGIATFANEQSIREIYLEAFNALLDAGSLAGVMSSYNRIGVVWAGAHRGLMTNVLRDEMNAQGIAITDCSTMAPYMDARLGILAGSDLWDGSGNVATGTLLELSSNPAIVQAMKEATQQIAYTVVSSNGVNGISSSDRIVSITPWWKTLLISMDALFGVSAIALGTWYFVGKKK